MTEQDYLNLITSQHENCPNFLATVSISVSGPVQIQSLMNQLIACYDIDDVNNCVGVFLDQIGQWVGCSRIVKIPIGGVFFTWDDQISTGFDHGIWEDPNSPGAVTSLPDDVFRTLIKATIAANHWDGTTEGAYSIWEILFPNLNILIQDNQDMTMSIGFQGSVPDSLTLALIIGGYIQLRQETVGIREYFIPTDTNPLFAWDVVGEYLGGWGSASWASEVYPS